MPVNSRLTKLRELQQLHMLSMDPLSYEDVVVALETSQPDEVYCLSSQSSVYTSFKKPKETFESIAIAILNILEACKNIRNPIRIYHAGTSECFGNTGTAGAHEETPFLPLSPYAIAKCAAIQLVDNYRNSYDMWACSGILFNHESPLRPIQYVTQKIIRTAIRISNGSHETLYLGDLSIARDWGWAPEYVDAMWRMLQQPKPENYVIATGQTYTLEEFVEEVFTSLGLIWRDHVQINDELIRPNDLAVSRADPTKASVNLGWRAQSAMPEVIRKMIGDALEDYQS